MHRFVLLCTLAACGRIGFDAADSRGVVDARGGGQGGDGDGAPASAITYVQPIVQRYPGAGATDSFTIQAQGAGDAVVLMVACAGAGTPTSVTVTAPGWTLSPLSPLTLDPPAQIAAASFGALAPDTAPATVSIAWTGTNCNRGKTEVGDELAGTLAGPAAFDAHGEAGGTGNCTTSVTTSHDGDAVWAACYSATTLTSIGAGFTPGATDGNGDFAEYKLTADVAGTVEPVTFTNTNGFVVVASALAPR